LAKLAGCCEQVPRACRFKSLGGNGDRRFPGARNKRGEPRRWRFWLIDECKQSAYSRPMIKTFRSKELANLWAGSRSRIDPRMHSRILRRLDRLEVVEDVSRMNLPGFDFHTLQGFNPARYTVHINGPWCITFEFTDGDAYQVDFEQYH
jgi:proteic killer suppression protein